MPPRFAYLIARFFGIVLYYGSPRKRRAIERELAEVLTWIERKDYKEAVRNTLKIQAQNEVEVMFFPLLNPSNIGEFTEIKGRENLDEALRRGKGAMLLFAHFGANQIVMPAIGYRGYKMSQMSAPATVWAEKWPERFTASGREALELRWKHELSLPVKHINIFGSMKEVFLCLKRNEILGIAIDGGGGKNRALVDFFGKRAYFSTGAVEIAMRTGCAVLPTFMVRGREGKNSIVIEGPLGMLGDDESKDAAAVNTAAFVRRLEEYVRRYPCHYLGFMSLRRFMEGLDGNAFIIEKGTER